VSLLLLLWFAGMCYGVSRPLPAGISIAGPLRTASVEVLADVTYLRAGERVSEQFIFQRVSEIIDRAERFIVIDMFLFNDEHGGDRAYAPLSRLLVDQLLARKATVPNLAVTFITDEINNFYGAYRSELLSQLEAAGVQVVITDLTKLRDSNPAYSSIWRMLLQWFGTGGYGFVPHPLSSRGRRVTVRSYLKMLNFKANHRKLIVTDNACLVASANPHDASSFHSNIAFVTHGGLCQDILDAERAVAAFSGATVAPQTVDAVAEAGRTVTAQLVTEGAIRTKLLDAMNATVIGDTVDIAMFYLSDRSVIDALRLAAERSVKVRLILDPNKDAFGREKGGVPNRQVARELRRGTDGAVQVRWFDTHGEQFHTKLVRIKHRAVATIIGGSANLTRRNLGDYNLEADLVIVADSALDATVAGYFERLWTNRDGQFTVDFSMYDDPSRIKQWQYRIQEFTGLSSF
jgi:phosphatidylserine/phosphatidylglycerophosphate/cardiolipin synthase-like enzyme